MARRRARVVREVGAGGLGGFMEVPPWADAGERGAGCPPTPSTRFPGFSVQRRAEAAAPEAKAGRDKGGKEAKKRKRETARGGEKAADDAQAPAQKEGKAANKQGLDAMLARMRSQLAGGRFRMLNEFLYTSTGKKALARFQDEPTLFDEYHEGYRAMASKWPAGARPAHAAAAFVRRAFPTRNGKGTAQVAVADLGCGDAELHDALGKDNITVHSFDLYAAKPHVVAADIADLSAHLDDASVDVAVFCLALMGTDYAKALSEAARVTKPGGFVYVVEVRSRFPEASAKNQGGGGGAAKGAKRQKAKANALEGASFVRACERNLGLVNVVHSHAGTPAVMPNDFFVTLILQKPKSPADNRSATAPWPILKACEYKRR